MPLLQNHLVLHPFICREFGYDNMGKMLERLHDVPPTFDSGESEYLRALYLNPALAKVSLEQLNEYDANIANHSRKLRMTGEHGRSWKPHQYLALLFTEHYLRRYFDDPEALRADLNDTKADYTPDDLRTLAFQSATGSGKTLLMHAHILQYRHYLSRGGGRLNNVLLVTPNEQMSDQHERELRESGLQARIFSSEAGSNLFSPVEIIDLNKLAEKKGVKRVAVGDFGDNNLVLVDEGHLGASGKVWRERRQGLAHGGFTFEYSATFNQVTAGKNNELLKAYSKCLIFDYAYRRFHADGYGKDYAILNLPGGAQDDNSRMYLLGCLLTFYQQCRIYQNKAAQWQAFNLAKPLWVFLGKTVTGSSRADTATRSDVVQILNFLGWFLAHEEEVRPMLDLLLDGESGLIDDTDSDYFAGRFPQLRSLENLYEDVCQILFHGPGWLRVVYLTTGEGELHLRSADNVPFGVVNVGDSPALYKLLDERPNLDFDVEREMGFAARLFGNVDQPNSTVNIVIGARRFIVGWNSWRVSTMGLMHVGTSEGPEIIQMFGRGVRLKGWNMSLKRHRESGAETPEDSDQLAELERLYIFGLRANYMQTFRDLLEKEGMSTEQKTFSLPVTWNFPSKTDLKLIRLRADRRYDLSADRLDLPGPDEADSPVTLDLYSRLQSVESSDAATGEGTSKKSVSLKPYAVFFDVGRIHDRLRRRKGQKGWRNLIIKQHTVERLLQSEDWYSLYLPPERMSVNSFGDLQKLEDIAVDLLTEYADYFWRRQRRRWEHDEIEVVALEEDNPNNIRAYALSVDTAENQMVREVENLAYNACAQRYDKLDIEVVLAKAHACQPLLHAGKDCKVEIQPVPLDVNEKRVVEGLAALAQDSDPCLQGKELFLIRNMTGTRGVSFFDDFAYYPDFIVWLKDAADQHVVFLDPKGLSRFGEKERRKVNLHTSIKETEKRARNHDPNLHLHAYILSVTPPEQIDDGTHSENYWNKQGVYFLNKHNCLQRVIQHALGISDGETTMKLDSETH